MSDALGPGLSLVIFMVVIVVLSLWRDGWRFRRLSPPELNGYALPEVTDTWTSQTYYRASLGPYTVYRNGDIYFDHWAQCQDVGKWSNYTDAIFKHIDAADKARSIGRQAAARIASVEEAERLRTLKSLEKELQK